MDLCPGNISVQDSPLHFAIRNCHQEIKFFLSIRTQTRWDGSSRMSLGQTAGYKDDRVQVGGRNLPGVSLPLLDQVHYLPSRSALEHFDFCIPQTKESNFGILKPFALRKSALAFGSGGEGNGDATLIFILQTSPIWAKVMLFGSLLCLLLEISTSNPDAAHTARAPSGGLQSRSWCWQ